MPLLIKIKSILLALLTASQSPLRPWLDKYFIASEPTHHPIINTEVTEYIENLIDLFNVTGLALTVVRPDGDVEFGSWGNQTEDGDKVTPEVSYIWSILQIFNL